MRVFFNAILVQTLLNIYVFGWGWKFIPFKNIKLLLSIIFGVEFIVYMIGFIVSTSLPDHIFHNIAIIGTSWMIFILYMTGFLMIYDFFFLAGRRYWSIRNILNQKCFKRPIYYTVSCGVVLLLMIWGSFRFWNPTVSTLDITIPKTTENVKSLKVVMVSDLHIGYLINRDVLKIYVDKIMEQKPDLILMVGDIIDHHLEPLNKEKMEEELRRLKAPYGVYGSTGNHEYREDVEKNVAWLENKAGIRMLRDATVKVADSFYIIGREDDQDQNRDSLSTILQKYNVDKNLPLIVMNHEPHDLKEEADNKVDVALYGHTHNGQLFPANLLISAMYELGHGYKKKDETHCYVSSGLGLSGPQYRIGTISEIVVLNIQFER